MGQGRSWSGAASTCVVRANRNHWQSSISKPHFLASQLESCLFSRLMAPLRATSSVLRMKLSGGATNIIVIFPPSPFLLCILWEQRSLLRAMDPMNPTDHTMVHRSKEHGPERWHIDLLSGSLGPWYFRGLGKGTGSWSQTRFSSCELIASVEGYRRWRDRARIQKCQVWALV